MPTYFKSRTAVVRYVNDRLKSLRLDSVWTTIIKPEPSGGYSVITVTDVLSEDTAPLLLSSEQLTNTSLKITPDG